MHANLSYRNGTQVMGCPIATLRWGGAARGPTPEFDTFLFFLFCFVEQFNEAIKEEQRTLLLYKQPQHLMSTARRKKDCEMSAQTGRTHVIFDPMSQSCSRVPTSGAVFQE